MKPKTVKTATPLPKVEWDFYELDDEETSLAFYYEYGRSSVTVKSEVKKMRDERNGYVWNYWPREHRLGAVICWLAQQESFPNTPWLALPGKGIERLVGMRGGNVNLRPSMSFKHVWGGDVQASRKMLSERANTFVPPENDEIGLNPAASYFEFGVNWHLTNKEILDRVAAVIKDSRPEQFEAFAKTPLVQRGFRDESLPFRKGAALAWLGVLRQRNTLNTWSEFFHLYHTGNFERGDERARIADLNKAKLILDWFDAGTSLKKIDFR